MSPVPALPWLLIHPQTELHALQLVAGIEGDIPSLSPLPVLSEEPVCFDIDGHREIAEAEGRPFGIEEHFALSPKS